jgi:hypothetical protein
MQIKIAELIGKNAITYVQAEKLYKILSSNLNQEFIELNFEGVGLVASPFFNGSIGLLLEDNDIKYLQEKIIFKGLSVDEKYILNLSIQNAINHYKK